MSGETRGPSHAWCSGFAAADGSCRTCGAWPTAAIDRIAALEAERDGYVRVIAELRAAQIDSWAGTAEAHTAYLAQLRRSLTEARVRALRYAAEKIRSAPLAFDTRDARDWLNDLADEEERSGV